VNTNPHVKGLDLRRGFSLVELLVVLAILGIILGISASLLRGENRDAQVRRAAEELASVLRATRSRAMHEQAAYAVVFNIQNAPGTSGRVLNNWSGGHWYRVLGPSTYGYAEVLFGSGASSPNIPLPGPRRTVSNTWMNANFPEFLDRVRVSWVDEPHILPAKRVRFLALSDTDEGPRNTKIDKWSVARADRQTWYGVNGETTYPRPWFGYFDETAQRLFPWGGYDPSKDVSGFFYEGSDGDVSESRHPVDRSYNNDFNGNGNFTNVDYNGDGDFDDPFEHEVGYPIYRQGEPRPLVDAAWMDAAIMFTPSGEAIFLEWARGRWAYSTSQRAAGTNDAASEGNGVQDRSKLWKTNNSGSDGFGNPIDVTTEVAHFVQHTGGWYLTLGPDMVSDSDSFPNSQSALNSILPAYRVFVGKSGVVRTTRVQRRGDGYLDGKAVWPPLPSDWLRTGTTTGNLLWKRCRMGWLHQLSIGDSNNPDYNLIPTGKPISTVVTERMLSDRIWWIDE
jgi:prepilin-type N-terminal cleavage/methylation domain-containing protein